MIVKMKKVTMVVQTKDKEITLDSLRELGLIHLEDFQSSSAEVEEASAELGRASTAYVLMAEFKPGKETPAPPSLDGRRLTEKVLSISDEIYSLKDRITSRERQIAELEKWGDFEPEDINYLARKGLYIRIYTASDEQIANIPEENVVVLRKEKDSVAFAHVSRTPDHLEDFEEFVPPAKSLSALKEEVIELSERIVNNKETLVNCFPLRPVLQQYMAQMESEMEYQVAKANMLKEGDLTAIVGYIPVDKREHLKDWAADNSVAVAVTEPVEEDPIPTEVRNPRWLKIIEPIFDFLNTVPGYKELNVSFFFFAFFIIFFSMIIGDAAYGIIFLLGGGLPVILSMRKKQKVPLIGILMIVLGFGTVVWGTMNGQWFGHPEMIKGTFLERLVVPQLTEGIKVYSGGELYKTMSGNEVVMLMCFIIAIIHLTIAQVWNFLRQLTGRSLRAVAELGWMCINFGLFYLVLDMVIYFDLDKVFATGELLRQLSIYLIFGGLALVLFFGSQEGNFFKGVMGGLKDLLPSILNIVGAFGDIISYIRLFAVGLAGAEIARSFNAMAGDLLEGNTFILGVLILLLGHTLNFVLCSLGVLVHGVRLNMLEFSGRLGIEWSGHRFKPFSKPANPYMAASEEKTIASPSTTV